MKLFKSLTLLFLISSFFNCSTNYKLKKKSPLKFHKIEAQKWVSANANKDSGIRMYFILPSDINATLDSVYFNNLRTNIYKGTNKNTYFANFKATSNLKETNNKFPFELKNNECVVSYIENNKIKYYKYTDVKVKL